MEVPALGPIAPVAPACIASVWVSLFPCYGTLSFVSFLMIIYSLIPLIFPLLIAVRLIWKRQTTPALALVFLGIIMLICEGILKHAIKQPRPVGSCDCSYGMPSSHSATSYGFLVWIYLEVGFPLGGFRPAPGSKGWQNPVIRRVVYLAAATVAFVPVPFSRVYFLYHSISQVLVGILVGSVLALCWFGLLRGLIAPKNWLDKLVELRPFRFIKASNDYRIRPLQQSSSGSIQSWENEHRAFEAYSRDEEQ